MLYLLLFQSTPCKHPVIVLQDVAWTDLHALVEFIYHGEVNVHQRSLSSFLKTAEVLRVSGLTQQHGDDRESLAQVQSPVRLHQQTPPTSNHHHHHHHPLAGAFPDKLVEDSLFTSPTSPPHGSSTVHQLLRRAAMQNRRDRRISADPDTEHKRARSEHIIGNNNNNNNELNLSTTHQPPPPQTQPADFSPSAMKAAATTPLNLNASIATKSSDVEGNGISSTENESSRPCSPSPTTNNNAAISRMGEDQVKSEPMELLCSGGGGNQQEENSNDSDAPNDNGPSNLPQGPHSGSSGGDHDDHDSPMGPYLTTAESKLFAGNFNFGMALAADPTGLGG
ncbi:btb domain transcription factor [Holotrichia oblita]|uniref:Btb domain transcription factor n=1 Tax=Holotrichia oblita TaxID=644536 RepID=A0ACB9SQV0_HOLOL|nr:btb domain transcription factor [Holotrichia oblita]